MQPVAFLAVIVVALVFLGYEGLNFCNDILALRKLLGCAQLVKLALGSVVDDKIRFMRGIELLLVLFLAILLDNGIGVAVIVHCFQHLPKHGFAMYFQFIVKPQECGVDSFFRNLHD